jgi:hypothetical protein
LTGSAGISPAQIAWAIEKLSLQTKLNFTETLYSRLALIALQMRDVPGKNFL